MHRSGTAILALTRGGTVLAGLLASRMAVSGVVSRAVEVHVPERFREALEPNDVVCVASIDEPVSRLVTRLFVDRAELVFIASAGVVVRLIAPLLVDKTRDPAVLVIDEAGRFVIPILSGHLGGANASAQRIAGLLGATAVLTTSSDVQETIAVDLLGRKLGWRVEADREALLHAAAAVVNGERVVIIEEACGREWWSSDRPLPENLDPVGSWDRAGEASAYLWVTRKAIDPALKDRLGPRLVVYRPEGSDA
ncbi:cobalamin biosynthesis central domain-containing protein [Thiocapsa sp. UBA6158]|uniref:cobalamin biosynthesis central domain-containing protein n=1 Tax=Thiocapsa sp. UBA6158 TaxID=1947692 RepID=UPI0025F0710A|nr:cobalamin biosynthesis central domain-containing protein [Thiocapsa sp. UBA6158]